MSGTRTLVVGGYGFVGSSLISALLSQGDQVLVVDNLNTGSRDSVTQNPRLSHMEADISRAGEWQENVARFEPECVFHLAAIHFIPYCNSHPAQTLTVNVVGTQNVLDCLSGVKGLVFASSAAVYGINDLPHQETEPLAPTDVYGLTKRIGEDLLALWSRSKQVPCRAARPFNVYGPNATNSYLIPEIMRQAMNGNELQLGNIETKRDFIFVGDVVSGLIAIMKTTTSGPLFDSYNVGTGSEYSAKEIVQMLGEVIDRPLIARSIPERYRPSDRMHYCADNSKLRATGWTPTLTIRDGLKLTWEHLVKTGEEDRREEGRGKR